MTGALIRLIVVTCLLVLSSVSAAAAQNPPVGERHLLTTDTTAALRDAGHSTQVRVTIWYPAAEHAVEKRIDIGPPGDPLFSVGAVAQNAPFVDEQARPVILLSHGFGGSARIMAWFGTALARHGYVVVAVDHPGNNSLDTMTSAGAVMNWDRVQDLQAAWNAAKVEPEIGPHLDRRRLGLSGFSAGGFTALVGAGARVDIQRFDRFCQAHPADGVCAPQKEFVVTREEARRTLAAPTLAAETARAGEDHRIEGIGAVFAMAPALVQELTPESLARIKTPVAIVLGDADRVAPPDTNGLAAAKILPHATLKVLPGVGHYDFLSLCTPAGAKTLPICNIGVPQTETHAAAIDMALAFFDKTLRH